MKSKEELAEEYASAYHGKEDDPLYGGECQHWFNAYEDFLAGYDAATKQMQAKLAIAVEALEFVRNGGAPNGVVASVNERMLAMCEAATKALAKLGSESFGEKA